jgi:hypothetical protein
MIVDRVIQPRLDGGTCIDHFREAANPCIAVEASVWALLDRMQGEKPAQKWSDATNVAARGLLVMGRDEPR